MHTELTGSSMITTVLGGDTTTQTTMCAAGVTSSREAKCAQLKCMLCGQHIRETEGGAKEQLGSGCEDAEGRLNKIETEP